MNNKNDDDGRTVSNMEFTKKTNWYENFSKLTGGKRKTSKKQNIHDTNISLTKKETKSIILSSLLAAMSIALIFIVVFYLFLLFCVFVWLK